MYSKLLTSGLTATLCRSQTESQPLKSLDSRQSIGSQRSISFRRRLPTREQQIDLLKKTDYDVLVIGGGATGTGCALDAATRGLRTALIEADDFASGASSKTTKLMFGDMNLIRSMIAGFNFDLFKVIRLMLRERAILMEIAPHLIRPIPILVPIYNKSDIPYYWLGLKCYDLVAGAAKIGRSHIVTKSQMYQTFPMLREDLRCGMIYYDGIMNDARICVALALTAAAYGANICNHLQVKSLPTQDNPISRIAVVRDSLTGESFEIGARCIVNATGPFTDLTRFMDNKYAERLIRPIGGSHIVLPNHFCSRRCGLHDPCDRSGRELYILPWQGQSLAGTTRIPCDLTNHPQPSEVEVNYILDGIRSVINRKKQISKKQLISTWSGIRPAVGTSYGPQALNERSQLIEISKQNLITVTGGKFALYRNMAEETINAAITACKLNPENSCATANTIVYGAQNWTPRCALELVQYFDIPMDVARHLSETYGSNSLLLLSAFEKSHKRLHSQYPFIEAEVHYACIYEYAETLIDIIARRLPMTFIDVGATLQMLPKILLIMEQRLYWTEAVKDKQIRSAKHFLNRQMGLNTLTHPRLITNETHALIDLTKEEMQLMNKS